MGYFSKKQKKDMLARKKKATKHNDDNKKGENDDVESSSSDSSNEEEGVSLKLTPLLQKPTPIKRGFKVMANDDLTAESSTVALDGANKSSMGMKLDSATKKIESSSGNFANLKACGAFEEEITAVVSGSGVSGKRKRNVVVHVVPLAIVSEGGEALRNYRKKIRREENKKSDEDSNSIDVEIEFVNEEKKKKKAKIVEQVSKKKSFPRLNDLAFQETQEKMDKKIDEKAAEKESKATEKLAKQILQNEPTDDEKKNYIALDCEMVGVGSSGKQSALARVSITAYDGSVLLDVFVKVAERVTDFRTFVSGVRASDLKSSETISVKDCRDRVFKLTDKKFLVGHALKNDFKALLMTHPRNLIRDTASYGPYMRAGGRNGGKLKPRKLRDITKEYLGQDIQVKGEEHDSIDDARAAMNLYIRARGAWERTIAVKGRKGGKKDGKKGILMVEDEEGYISE